MTTQHIHHIHHIIKYMKENTVGDFHPVGTCKIGKSTEPDTVVDGSLRVIGVRNLRIADASDCFR